MQDYIILKQEDLGEVSIDEVYSDYEKYIKPDKNVGMIRGIRPIRRDESTGIRIMD